MLTRPTVRPLARPLAHPLVVVPQYDADAVDYFARAGVTDPVAKRRWSNWARRLKANSIFDKQVQVLDCRPTHNASSTSTVYDFTGDFDLTLINGPEWQVISNEGISFDGVNQYSTSALSLFSRWTNFTLFFCGKVASDTQTYSMFFGQENSSSDEGNGMIRRDAGTSNAEVWLAGQDGNVNNPKSVLSFDSFDLISFHANGTATNLKSNAASNSIARTTFLPGNLADRVGFGARSKSTTPEYFAKMTAALGAVFVDLTDAEVDIVRTIYAETLGEGLL